jgi:hypothetical protein
MSERFATPETDQSGNKRARRNPAIRQRRAALSVPEASAGMLIRQMSVRAADVVFVKGVIEASDGLAVVFAERGGELTIAAPRDRGAELAELLCDLVSEIGGKLDEQGVDEGSSAAEPSRNASVFPS